jgi:uncharacterized membrane protein
MPMPRESKKHAELDRLRAEYNKTFALEIIFGILVIATFFSVFFIPFAAFSAWLVAIFIFGILDVIFEYKRKRLARKIDVAEGVQAAEEDPLKILKRRLAKGEITKKEYEEMKKALES